MYSSGLFHKIRYQWLHDNYFSELKESEIWQGRFNLMLQAEPFIGRHISNDWSRRNIFRQTDDDIEEIDTEIDAELQMPQFNPPALEPPMPPAPMPGGPPTNEAEIYELPPMIVDDEEEVTGNAHLDEELKEALIEMIRKEDAKEA